MSSDSESALVPSTVGWDDMPTEIYFYIFKKMDVASLRCCFSVSKKWKEIATSLCELQDMWQALAEDGMVNNAIVQRQKSMLSWKDLYYNSLLWNYFPPIGVCKIGELERTHITNLHVYKDKLLVVNPFGVEYYDIETLEIIRLTSIELCVDVQESDDLLMVVTDVGINIFSNVTVFIKLDKDEEIDVPNCLVPFTLPKNESIHTFAETRRWKLVDNRVYVVDSRSCLWECSAVDKSLCVKALARFYGDYFTRGNALHSIHVIGEDVYIGSEWGSLLKCAKDSRMFRKVKTSEIPTKLIGDPYANPHTAYLTLEFLMSINRLPIYKFDAFIKYPFCAEFQHSDEAPLNMIHYHFDESEMTAALQHGDVVIRGFEDGFIEVHLLRDNSKLCLSVQNFDDDEVANPAVVSLEVYEINGMHKLFAATGSKMYSILLQYPDIGLEN